MAQLTTTNPADFAFRRQEFLAKAAWPEIEYRLRMAQFFDTEAIPARGMKAARFYRPRKALRPTNTQGATALTEGVMIARNSEASIGYLDCYAIQVGDDFSLSDISATTDILDRFMVTKKTIGKDASLFIDGVMTAAIMGNATTANAAKALRLGGVQTTLFNSNNNYAAASPQAPYFERFAGVVNTGNSANDFATHAGLTPANAKFTRLENLKVITQLQANDVEPPDGKSYPALISPLQYHDLRQDPTLVSAMTQRDNEKLYKYEMLELDGASFVLQTNPWVEAVGGYGTLNQAGKINTVLYMGKDAAGMIKLTSDKAGGSPTTIKFNILDQPDKSDIYNQTIVGSWKAYYGAILKVTSDATDVPHVVALRCQTSFQ